MAKSSEKYSSRYGRAIFEVVSEKADAKAILAFQNQLNEISILTDKEVGEFFGSPVFSQEEKMTILHAILEKTDMDPTLKRFLEVLATMGHISLLPEIAKEFEVARRDNQNQVKAFIRTAFAFKGDTQKRLSAALEKVTGKKVLLDVEVDEDLIGGVVARVGSVVYDATIQSYLSRIQEEF